jgi:hypothetical protein
MKIKFKDIRMAHKGNPSIKKPVDLANLILSGHGVTQKEIGHKAYNNIVKNCWDVLNRNFKKSINQQTTHTAKILVFDIETAPLTAYVWRCWKQNIYIDQLNSGYFMLTWSAKWLFEKNVKSMRLTGEEAINEDDSRITKGLWELINEADILIAHNGDHFDVRHMNSRFLLSGLMPPAPYQTIDTLKHTRKQFALPSYKLDYLGEILTGENKIHTEFQLWRECLQGNEESLAYMEKYNIKDVTLLEDVYFILRAWIKPHPNLGLYVGEDVQICPTCGSKDLLIEGKYATTMNLFDYYRCNNCNGTGRSRRASNIRDKLALLSSLPK